MSEAWLEPLSPDACLRCLRLETVGRMAVVVNDGPIILPVNYRLVEPPSGPLLVVRTRPGNVLDQAISNVAFEIDSIDRANQEGWSVLVQGELLHAYPASATAASSTNQIPGSSTTEKRGCSSIRSRSVAANFTAPSETGRFTRATICRDPTRHSGLARILLQCLVRTFDPTHDLGAFVSSQ